MHLAEDRERNQFETPEYSVLNKVCPQEKLTRAYPNGVTKSHITEQQKPDDIIRAQLTWKKGYHQHQPTFTTLFHLKGRKKLRNTCEAHSPEFSAQ